MIFTNLHFWSLLLFLLVCTGMAFSFFLLWKQRRFLSPIFFLYISVVLLCFSFLGVKGGIKPGENKNAYSANVLFALDVSKSMKALDYEGTSSLISRISFAKQTISSLLVSGNKYGLLVFAGEALEIFPFASDIGLFQTILSSIDERNVSEHGSNMAELFLRITDFFVGEDDGGIVFIFTDGGDEEEDILEDSLEILEKKNVEIVLVGVGKQEGSYIPEGRDVFGNIIYKTYQGKRVVTQLNESKLKGLASRHGFEYMSGDELNNTDIFFDLIESKSEYISTQLGENKKDFTRVIAFLSFCFFLLYIIFTHFVGKRK